jgi:hypothetical protein
VTSDSFASTLSNRPKILESQSGVITNPEASTEGYR